MAHPLPPLALVLAFFLAPAFLNAEEVDRRILHTIRGGCAAQPNPVCIKALWRIFDIDGDGSLSTAEIAGTATAITRTFRGAQKKRTGTMVDLPLGRLLGPVSARFLMAAYDINGDGRLTRKELGSHFRPGEMRRLYADARELAHAIYLRERAGKRSSGPRRITVSWAQMSNILKTLLRPRGPSPAPSTDR